LSWKHCLKLYEFRDVTIPIKGPPTEAGGQRVHVRARFEHALCPMGRKQGPIVHSLTLLPQEQVKIYEYDRFARATSVTARTSQRTSLYTFVGRVSERLADTKVSSGAAFSTVKSSAQQDGGDVFLGIFSFGGASASSSSVKASGHFDVDSVFESFNQVVETASLAVETERSIVVSSFSAEESGDSSVRTLRNDNHCRAVTYFIRRVFEVYCLTTRLAGIEVQVGNQWVDLAALPPALKQEVLQELGTVAPGVFAQRSNEIALPTDGLLYEAELAHCSSCEPEAERRHKLEVEKLALEVELMARENERRKALLAASTLTPFEPCCPDDDDDDDGKAPAA
jgi:thermitase